LDIYVLAENAVFIPWRSHNEDRPLSFS